MRTRKGHRTPAENLMTRAPSPDDVPGSRADYLLVIAAGVIFGTSFPAIKLAVGASGDVDPLLLTFLRLSIGAGSGLLFLLLRRRFTLSVFRNPYVWLLGALNTIGFDLQHLGQVYTTASKTALLVDVNVVFIAIFMVAVYRERMTWRKALGIALGLGGVAVLTTRLDPTFLQQGEFVGDLLVFLAGVVWAVFVLDFKEMIDRGGDYLALSVGALTTTFLFSAIALPWARLSAPITGIGWVGIAWLGLVTTFPPIAIWARSIRVISPTVAAILLLIEVAVAGALSILFFGEPFGVLFAVGGLLVLAGTVVASLGDRAPRRTEASGPGNSA